MISESLNVSGAFDLVVSHARLRLSNNMGDCSILINIVYLLNKIE